jgi:ribosomal protein S18 acetylase RimI-like enzyme
MSALQRHYDRLVNADGAGELVLLDASNWRRALEVRVGDDQLWLVADYQPIALVVLAKACVQQGEREWEPMGFTNSAGEFVAVFALAHGETVSEITNFAVNQQHQGQGVGKRALAATADWCRSRGSTILDLTVNPKNARAQALYTSAGMSPTGEERNGEPIWSMTLGLPTSDHCD